MKVKELVKQLSKVDQNMDVILSMDEEGNGFSSLINVEIFKMDSNDDMYSIEDNEAPKGCNTVVVLWP